MKNAAGPGPAALVRSPGHGSADRPPVAPRFSSWEPVGRRGESKSTAARSAQRAFPEVSPAHDPHEESDPDLTWFDSTLSSSVVISRWPLLLFGRGRLGRTAALETAYDAVAIVVEGDGEGRHDDGEQDHLSVVAGRCLRALSGEDPRARDSP